MRAVTALLAASVVLSGCQAPRSIYYWGNFEPALYARFSKPGAASPAEQIQLLEADVEKARAAGRQVPPGLYAELGLLYLEVGQPEKAATAWEMEKRLFPESAVLMDRMLSRLAAERKEPS